MRNEASQRQQERPLNPQHAKHMQKAQTLERSGQTLDASITYRAFLRREPRHTDGWSDLAGQLIMLGQLDEAKEAFDAALR